MKKCPFCAQKLRDEAHHCHYCNSTIVDMDGKSVAAGAARGAGREMELLDRMMKMLVMIFFTIQFFIGGIIVLRLVFGLTIIEMNSAASIIANIVLLAIAAAGAWLISPHIIKWAKQNFSRVTK
jgi:hypothetical protein